MSDSRGHRIAWQAAHKRHAPVCSTAGTISFDRGRYKCRRLGCSNVAGALRTTAVGPRPVGSRLRDQVELAGLGHGLGSAGRAQLVEDVTHVTLDGVECDHELGGDLPVPPARG
jgi:hypothetical protein